MPVALTRKGVNRTLFLIKRRLQQVFNYHCSEMISTKYSKNKTNCGNKLRTFSSFKQTFSREKYLSLKDPVQRRALSRFRLSAHKLNVETGRYNSKNRYVKPEERICTSCTLGVCEDERHFLIDCPLYDNLRDNLYSAISERNVHFCSYTPIQKFTWLMTTEDLNCLSVIASFIHKAMKLRESANLV